MNLELSGNVAAVSDDSIDGDTKMIGYFFVCHSLNQADDDVFLTV